MAISTVNTTLNDDTWQEVGDGPVFIIIESGASIYVVNGTTLPVGNGAHMTISNKIGERSYSYGGTEKTYAKVAEQSEGTKTIIAATAIVT